jgi:hypothetical protein
MTHSNPLLAAALVLSCLPVCAHAASLSQQRAAILKADRQALPKRTYASKKLGTFFANAKNFDIVYLKTSARGPGMGPIAYVAKKIYEPGTFFVKREGQLSPRVVAGARKKLTWGKIKIATAR